MEGGGEEVYTPLISAPRKYYTQRQADFEFETYVVHRSSSRTTRVTERKPVSNKQINTSQNKKQKNQSTFMIGNKNIQ